MLEDEVQNACAEGVARAGCLDHAAQLAGRDKDVSAVIEAVAPVAAGGDVQHADVGEALLQSGRALVKIRLAGHELDLVVRDLENVTAGESPLNGFLRALIVRPEGRAEVRIEGDQRPGPFCDLPGADRGALARLVRQGEGAEVENAAAFQQLLIQLVRAQHDVRAGLAVKAEIPVAVGEGVHHRQRRGDVRVASEGGNVDPGLLHRDGQHIAEAVLTHLADEGAVLAELAQHGQHVCGRAAGVCLEEKIALFAQAVLGKIDQQLAQGDNVKFFVLHCNTSYRVKKEITVSVFSPSVRIRP